MVADSCSAVCSQRSQRCCIGRIRPPPTPTTAMPPSVASTVISTGVVTVVATSIWLSAAITPSARMNTDAMLASTLP
jgi:hypothetical protein